MRRELLVLSLFCSLGASASAAPSDEIVRLERVIAAGQRSADVDYNLALAYLARSESPQATATDAGQAAAGLQSVLAYSSDAQLRANARQALERVQAQIVHRRTARGETSDFLPSEGVARSTLRTLGEQRLSYAALLLGLVLSLWLSARRTWAAAVLLFAGFGLSAAGALFLRAERQEQRQVVIVADDARGYDASKVPLPGPTLSQGAALYVKPAAPGWLRAYVGGAEVWISEDAVRVISPSL